MTLLFLVSCNTVPIKKELTFNALILENNSGSDLENVRIEARKTGAFAACGVIFSGSSCSTTFRAKVYQGNSVHISWLLKGKEQQIGPLFVQQPEVINHELPARIVIRFNSDNDVIARFMY